MSIHVWNAYFTRREQAIAEIEATGLFLLEIDIDPSKIDSTPHLHDFGAHIYVLEGALELHETDADRVHKVLTGGKVVVTPGTRHYEGPYGYRAVIGLTVDPSTLVKPGGRSTEGRFVERA